MNTSGDPEIGYRVRIKLLQPWAGELGTVVCLEKTLVGWMYRVRLDNGQEVLQRRGGFVVKPLEKEA